MQGSQSLYKDSEHKGRGWGFSLTIEAICHLALCRCSGSWRDRSLRVLDPGRSAEHGLFTLLPRAPNPIVLGKGSMSAFLTSYRCVCYCWWPGYHALESTAVRSEEKSNFIPNVWRPAWTGWRVLFKQNVALRSHPSYSLRPFVFHGGRSKWNSLCSLSGNNLSV